MSTTQLKTQPTSPGSFFRLPPELRLLIWELVSFDHPRVCSLARHMNGMGVHPNLCLPETESAGLFVYDYHPVTRYICRESRAEAIYHSAALGEPRSGHPRRRYQPDVDTLWLGSYGTENFIEFLYEWRLVLGQNRGGVSLPVAAVQARQARHIAIRYSSLHSPSGIMPELLLEAFPYIESVSMVIGNVGVENTMDMITHGFNSCVKLPQRPCKLVTVPRLEPIMVDVSEASILAWIRRYFMKRGYADAEKASIEFAKETGAAASRLHCRSLPQPQLAMILQQTSGGTTGEDEKWEEVPGCNGPD